MAQSFRHILPSCQVHCGGVWGAGLHKVISRLSNITESPIYHNKFSLEIIHKNPTQKLYFDRNMNLRRFMKQDFFFFTETNLCHKN